MQLLIALLGVSLLPCSLGRGVEVSQSVVLAPEFVAFLSKDFNQLANAISDSMVSAEKVQVSMVGMDTRRKLQSESAVKITYMIQCNRDECGDIHSSLNDPSWRLQHADNMVQAISSVAEASGFPEAVLSTATDVYASLDSPALVRINIPRIPGTVAAAEGYSPAQRTWRIKNSVPIDDQWIISELQMFSDPTCNNAVTPTAVSWSDTNYDSACNSDSTCPLLFDGVCDRTPECCDSGTKWAGNDDYLARAAGGTWVSYTFAEPTEVHCIQICQSGWSNQQVNDVMLQFLAVDYTSQSNPESWIDAESYTFEAFGESQVGGRAAGNGEHGDNIGSTCHSERSCPVGMFCNFDAGNSGYCEVCSDCITAAGGSCFTCGLMEIGEGEC
eukprot:SAG11_NODE_3191_length_2622_cov_2.164487_1_plen_385_part_10